MTNIQLMHKEHQNTHHKRDNKPHLSSYGLCQLLNIDEDVKNRFADVGVEFNHRVAEFLNILSQQLVGVTDSVVQVTHLVVCEASVMGVSLGLT